MPCSLRLAFSAWPASGVERREVGEDGSWGSALPLSPCPRRDRERQQVGVGFLCLPRLLPLRAAEGPGRESAAAGEERCRGRELAVGSRVREDR